jgi:hypothetical protein
MRKARTAKPIGQYTIKAKTKSAIQAGFPSSSSLATIGMAYLACEC